MVAWRWIAGLILIFAAPVAQGADAAPPWLVVLQPYLQQVATDNGAAVAAALSADAAARIVDAAAALPDPMIAVGMQAVPTDFSFTRENMTQAPVLSLRQEIPFGGERRAQQRVAVAHADLATARRRATLQERGRYLAEAYIDLLRIERETAAVETAIDWTELLIKSITIAYTSGRRQRVDLDQALVERGGLQADRSDLLGQRGEALARIAEVLPGRPDLSAATAPSEVIPPRPWIDPDDVPLTAPQLQLAQAAQAVARGRREAAAAAFGPDLLVEGAYGFRSEDRPDSLALRVGISIPLWARNSQRPRLDSAELDEAAADAAARDVAARVQAAAEALEARWRASAERQQEYAASVLPAARAAVTSAQAAYTAGLADIFTPITAIRRQLQAEREYARIVAARRTTEARLAALAGTLIPDQGERL